MFILKILFWTIVGTTWVFGTIAAGLKGGYHFEAASRYASEDVDQHYAQAAVWWCVAVALPISALVTLIVWMVR